MLWNRTRSTGPAPAPVHARAFAPILALARTHTAALLSLMAVVVVYTTALIAMPPQGLTHHDTGAKYLQVRNLRLTPSGLDWSINYPARPLDPQLEFVPFSARQHYVDEQGRIYLQWPIFLGLLTRIPWKLMGFWGLYVVPLLAGVGTAWSTYLLAHALGVPRRVAWLAVPLVGFATPVFIYSLVFFEHTLAAMLVTLSLLAAVKATGLPREADGPRQAAPQTPALHRQGRQALTGTVLSAILLAAAIYFRSELYVLALVMLAVLAAPALWSVVPVLLRMRGHEDGHGARQMHMQMREGSARHRAQAVWWLVAFVLALVPLWLFYAITEGTLLPLHAMWYFAPGNNADGGAGAGGVALPAVRYLASAGWRAIPDFLLGPQSFPLSPTYPLAVELAGLAGTALCVLAASGWPVRIALPWRLAGMGAGLALIGAATLPVLFSDQHYYNLHGFLLAGPFAALALWPPPGEAGGARRLYAVALLYIVLHALTISILSGLGPASRHEWGQRYLLPAYPVLTALALLAGWRVWGMWLHRGKGQDSGVRPIVPSLALAVLAVSFLLAGVGLGFSIRGYVALSAERRQVVEWQNLAGSLPGKEPLVTDIWWLPLNLAADFYSRPIMLAEGDSRLARWAEAMRQRGVAGFGFMTDDPLKFEGAWSRQVGGLHAEGPPQYRQGMWLQRYSFDDSDF